VTRIVTTVHRPKRPARKRKAVASKAAIVTTTSRKAARLARAEQPDDDPEADAAMRAWLERAKWGHGPG
jgi:hypothetical protein